jgi:hypothetical protein
LRDEVGDDVKDVTVEAKLVRLSLALGLTVIDLLSLMVPIEIVIFTVRFPLLPPEGGTQTQLVRLSLTLVATFIELFNWALPEPSFSYSFLCKASIIQTRNIQKKEHKRRMLVEVIDWAKEAAQTAISRQDLVIANLWATKLKYKYSKATSLYVVEIVRQSFNSLYPTLIEVDKKLDNAINITTQYIEGKEKDSSNLVASEQELRVSIEQLLKEIALIVASTAK